MKEIHHALRALARRPGFTVVVLVTLALGIGANAAVFSVVHAVLLRPLPYPEPERLVRLWSAYPTEGITQGTTSPVDLEDWRDESDVFDALAGVPGLRLGGFVLTGQGEPEELETTYVTEDFFEALGVGPAVGRRLEPRDHVEGQNRVVVLSHGAWRRRFGGDPAVVGTTLTLDGAPFEVAGVMPADLQYPSVETEIWAPLSLIPETGVPRLRQVRWLQVIGRLAEGAALEEARAEMSTIAARLAEAYPETNERLTDVTIRPLHDVVIGDVRAGMLTIFGGVGLVLLIACANVANLVLARSESRFREIAVRTALGAGRGRIVRQLLVESLLLAAAGGGLGLLVAAWGVRALVGLAPPGVPRLSQVGIDATVLAFTALVTVVATVLFGLVPALRVSTSHGIGQGNRSSEARDPRRFRSTLVVSEVALVVVLAVVAGLLLRSYGRLLSIDPGYEPERLLTLGVAARSYKYPDSEDYRRFFGDVQKALSDVPGIDSVGMVRPFPLRGDTFEGEDFGFLIEGRERPPEGDEPEAVMRFTGPGYFRTMGIPLLAGRDFTADDGPDREIAIVVNAAAAERYWPRESPVGRRIFAGETPATIVGVVGDIRQTELGAEPKPAIYVNYRQVSRVGMTFVVRTRSEPLSMVRAVQQAVWSVDPAQPVTQIATMEQVIERSVARERFAMTLLVAFAVVALALAAVGIYGVIAHTVSRETRAIGIRIAMGAKPSDVLRLVTARGITLSGAGIAIGLAGALTVTRLVESQLFGVTARDPVTFAAVAGLLATVALASSLVPALRARRIDPLVALRYE